MKEEKSYKHCFQKERIESVKKYAVKFIAAMSATIILSAGLAGCSGTSGEINPASEPVIVQESETVPGATTEPGTTTEPGSSEVQTSDGSGTATEEDYLAFVNGEAKIKATKDDLYGLKNGEEYSVEDLRNALNTAYDDMFSSGPDRVLKIEYAMIDCGKDNDPEMAVVVTGNDNPGGNEIMDYYIVKKINGELCIVAQFESYYRSFGELNKYGVFHTEGSGGAALAFSSYERVNAAGEYEFIYSEETEYAVAEPIIYSVDLPSDAVLPEDYPGLPWDTGNFEREKFSFEEYQLVFLDGSPEYDAYLKQLVYVFHDENGNVVYPDDANMEIYNGLGIQVTDDTAVKNRINERIRELGISEEEMYMLDSTLDSVPDWKTVWEK